MLVISAHPFNSPYCNTAIDTALVASAFGIPAALYFSTIYREQGEPLLATHDRFDQLMNAKVNIYFCGELRPQFFTEHHSCITL